MWWAKIAGWLMGLNINDIVSSVTTTLQVKVKAAADTQNVATQAEAQAMLASWQAEVDTFKLQQQLMIVEQGWWVTRLIRPGFAYLTMGYYGALLFGIKVPVLPDPWNYLACGIVGTFFLMRPFEKNSRAAMIATLKPGSK
jgi:hypothetical protein